VNAAENQVAHIVSLFENLQPQDIARLGNYYAANVRFKDPFNEVQGLASVQAVFEHMFRALVEPRFIVTGTITQGDQCFLSWDFIFRFRRFSTVEQTVRGASHLRFDATSGLVTLHRDYWDAAEELYEKLPLVGTLMRWLKRKVTEG
jgi:hypothetical protein